LENRRVEQVLPEVVGTSGSRKEVEKGFRRANMVQIRCTYVCKQKKRYLLKRF
jgi:hypothetical protein